MHRRVQAELLDSLPVDHPEAIGNRRDLRIVNAVMGNHRWIERQLTRHLHPGDAVLEIGAGTGELSRRLQARGIAADALDLWPAPPGWPAERRWHRENLLTFDGYDRYPVIVANLILHQFEPADLAELGRRLNSGPRLILASEPIRSRRAQWMYRLLAPLFGANRVSRHDGDVSIAAGFRERELPDFLGLTYSRWQIHCHSRFPGAYRMLAAKE